MLTYSQRLPLGLAENAHAQALSERRRQGRPLLDLTVSNPTLCLDDYPHEEIRAALSSVFDFTYNPDPFGNWDARLAVCDYYTERGIAVSPQQTLLTASTSEAYSYLFKLLCDPGDEILIPVPSYPLFSYLGALEAIRVVPYHLRYDGNWHIDFDTILRNISPRAKAIVVVHPNNPTGTFLSADEGERLLALSAEQNLAVIADEVFTDYRLGSNRNSFPSFIGDHPALTFSLNGLSKIAGMPQMKIGWMVVSGPSVEKHRCLERLEIIADTFLSVGTAVQKTLPKLLEAGRGVRNTLLDRITHNLKGLDDRIANTAVTRLHLEGGWSAILRLPETQSEERWVKGLVEERGVVTQPGYFFDMSGEAYLVVSLITRPATFREGIDYLCAYVAKHS